MVQSISLFLKFLGRNFHAMHSELSINPLRQIQHDFVEAKLSRPEKTSPSNHLYFKNRQQDILSAIPNIHTY